MQPEKWTCFSALCPHYEEKPNDKVGRSNHLFRNKIFFVIFVPIKPGNYHSTTNVQLYCQNCGRTKLQTAVVNRLYKDECSKLLLALWVVQGMFQALARVRATRLYHTGICIVVDNTLNYSRCTFICAQSVNFCLLTVSFSS